MMKYFLLSSKENLIFIDNYSNFPTSIQIALLFEDTLFDTIVLVTHTLNGMDPIDLIIETFIIVKDSK